MRGCVVILIKKYTYFLFMLFLGACSCSKAMNDSLAASFTFVNSLPKDVLPQVNVDESDKNPNPLNLYIINEPNPSPESTPQAELMSQKLKNTLSDKKFYCHVLVHYKTVEKMLSMNGWSQNVKSFSTQHIQFFEYWFKKWTMVYVKNTEYVLFVPNTCSYVPQDIEKFTVFTLASNTFLNSDKKICDWIRQIHIFLVTIANQKYMLKDAVENDKKDIHTLNSKIDIVKGVIDNNFLLVQQNINVETLRFYATQIVSLLDDMLSLIEKNADLFEKEQFLKKYYDAELRFLFAEFKDKRNKVISWIISSFTGLPGESLDNLWKNICLLIDTGRMILFDTNTMFNRFDELKCSLPEALDIILKDFFDNNQNGNSDGKKVTLYLNGHGYGKPIFVADLCNDDIERFKAVCKKYMKKIHVLVVDSCFAGGCNRHMLLDPEILIPLIIVGIDNLPTFSFSDYKEGYPRLIFEQLNKSLGDIEAIHDLFVDSAVNGSLHMYENMPFIFDPNKKMNIFCPQGTCHVLDTSFPHSNITPIKTARVLHVLGNYVNLHLKVATHKYEGNVNDFKKHILMGVPLVGKEFDFFMPKINNAAPAFNVLIQKSQIMLNMKLFPVFVPFEQKEDSHVFIKKISSYETDAGVFKIIRDMFLDGAKHFYSRKFFIETIENRNDLYETVVSSRKINIIDDQSEFEKKLISLKKNLSDKKIKLTCIRVSITPYIGVVRKMKYTVSFLLGGVAWEWEHDTKNIAAPIMFKKINKNDYKREFYSAVKAIAPEKEDTKRKFEEIKEI